jgi:hypothetical protein
MSSFFKDDFITTIDNLDYSIINSPVNFRNNGRAWSNGLSDNEIKYTTKSANDLLRFILFNNLFILPIQTINRGKIYRCAKIKALPQSEEFYPVKKSTISDCPGLAGSTPREPIWFAFHELTMYMNLTPNENENIGIASCRQIKNACVETNEVYFLLNFNVSGANLLDRELQYNINKAILIYIVRNYCQAYSLNSHPQDLTYDDIIANANAIQITRTVHGFECDEDYTRNFGTIGDLLRAWSFFDGTRTSTYNPDRIHIDVLFIFLQKLEETLNSYVEIFKQDFLGQLGMSINSRCRILGWYAEDILMNDYYNRFPGEIAISYNYFNDLNRRNVFNPRDPFVCDVKYYKVNPAVAPISNNTYGFSQINLDEFNYLIEIQREIERQRERDRQILIASQEVVMNGGGKKKYNIINNTKFSEKPENSSSDLYKVFFDNDEEEEKKYTKEPEYITEAIKNYLNKSTHKNKFIDTKFNKNTNTLFNQNTKFNENTNTNTRFNEMVLQFAGKIKTHKRKQKRKHKKNKTQKNLKKRTTKKKNNKKNKKV